MSATFPEESRTLARQLFEFADVHLSEDSGSDEEGDLRSQLLNHSMTTIEMESKIKPIVDNF